MACAHINIEEEIDRGLAKLFEVAAVGARNCPSRINCINYIIIRARIIIILLLVLIIICSSVGVYRHTVGILGNHLVRIRLLLRIGRSSGGPCGTGQTPTVVNSGHPMAEPGALVTSQIVLFTSLWRGSRGGPEGVQRGSRGSGRPLRRWSERLADGRGGRGQGR
eukprot:6361753-Pyramimonas_sp.AAC.1